MAMDVVMWSGMAVSDQQSRNDSLFGETVGWGVSRSEWCGVVWCASAAAFAGGLGRCQNTLAHIEWLIARMWIMAARGNGNTQTRLQGKQARYGGTGQGRAEQSRGLSEMNTTTTQYESRSSSLRAAHQMQNPFVCSVVLGMM